MTLAFYKYMTTINLVLYQMINFNLKLKIILTI